MVKDKRHTKAFEDKMKRFIQLVKKHESMSDLEITASWSEIERLLPAPPAKNKPIFRYLLAGISVAASIAIFCILTLNNTHQGIDYLSRLDEHISLDSINNISLVLSENKQIEIENDAEIQYNQSGSVTINSRTAPSTTDNQTQENLLNQIIVPKGKRTHIILSDGTKMYVNAASHVIYPTRFSKGQREIAVEGEVYLEVAHNPEVPFIVRTKGLEVKVLGTVFNLNAYKENDISVVLVNGRVEINSPSKEKMILNPSQKACLKDGVMTKEQVDVTKYICWKDNVMILESKTLSQVLDDLSRYYGVDIEYDNRIADRKLSGKLDLCENIEEVLDIIKTSSSLQLKEDQTGGYYLQ